MKKSVLAGLLFLATLLSTQAVQAYDGWDKGFYALVNVGTMQLNNDQHVVTNTKFSNDFELSYGLTLGADINMWIRPIFTINYVTATSNVGTANGAAGAFGAGTFPSESARQHALDISIGNRFTLPKIVKSQEGKNVRFLPYLKVAGTAHALFVNAPTDNNKVGAFGGGPSIGLGTSIFLWKGFVINIDVTEHLIIQKAYKTDIAGTNTKVTQGGFKPRFTALLGLGWHF